MDPIAHDGADAEFPHLSRRVSDYPVFVFQHDAKAAIGQDFIDGAGVLQRAGSIAEAWRALKPVG